MPLKSLIHDNWKDIHDIERYLDALDHESRCSLLAGLNRKDQRELYKKAAQSEPITLDHFVPAEVAPLESVNHFGRNTLQPLPRRYRLFEKRFCRPQDGSMRLFGYNQNRFSFPPVGPGYFVVLPTAGNEIWERRGACVIDYFQVPEAAVADGWPDVRPNDQGLSRFVFWRTRDFMRRVSEHVSVGAAFKDEKPLGQFFVLCRPD